MAQIFFQAHHPQSKTKKLSIAKLNSVNIKYFRVILVQFSRFKVLFSCIFVKHMYCVSDQILSSSSSEANYAYPVVIRRRWWFGDTCYKVSHCFMFALSFLEQILNDGWLLNTNFRINELKNRAIFYCSLIAKKSLYRNIKKKITLPIALAISFLNAVL